MTKEQAIAQANRFYSLYLRTAGQKPEKNNIASAQLEQSGSADVEPYWNITREDTTEIHIQDRDGLPIALVLYPSQQASNGRLRSERELEVDARKYRQMFASAGHFTEASRISYSVERCSFEWTRVYKAVPFFQQKLLISVDSTTGALKAAILGGWGWSDLPENRGEKISESQAREIALQKVSKEFKGPFRIKKSERQIVPRNYFWIDRSFKRLSESRFAWLVDIDVADPFGMWILVGVDSQTGEPVYGEIQQVR